MRTRTQPVAGRRPLPSPPPAPESWAGGLAVVGVLAAALLALFLSVYPLRHLRVPIGWDMSEYLWRTNLAREVGVAAIDRPVPSLAGTKSGRPAFPVVAGTVASLSGAGPLRVAMVLSPVMAVSIGLAAGAFAAAALRRPLRDLAVVAVAVSGSTFVVRMMMPEGYLDAMFASAVLLVGALALSLAAEDRRALPAAVLLLGGVAAVHWAVFAVAVAAVGLAAAALAPDSWRRWRSGAVPLADTPVVRLAAGVAGGAAVGAAVTFGLLGDALPAARVEASELFKKLRRDLPRYRLGFTLPVAALGALSAAGEARRDPSGRARFALAFLVAWAAVALAGVGAQAVLDLPVPGHRLLSMGLAIPVLGALGVLWAAGRAARVARPLGPAVVVGALALGTALGAAQWLRAATWTDPAGLQDAAWAARYLDAAGVPDSAPVVFIADTLDRNRAKLVAHTIRASLPARRIGSAYLFVGPPADLLAGRPAPTPVSREYFAGVREVLEADPVALALASSGGPSYRAWVRAHPGAEVGSRVAVVRGPRPPGPVPAPPPLDPVPAGTLALLGAGTLVLLAAAGLGWSVLLLGRWVGPAALLAVAPAVGVAALVAGGVLADRLGFRLAGAAGALVPLAVAGGGWGAVGLRSLRPRWLRGPSG